MKKIFSSLALFAVVIAGLFTTVPAGASNPTLNFYVAAPVIQNTYVSGATIESFNSMTTGSCPTTPSAWGIASSLTSVSTDGCTIKAPDASGGATSGANGTVPGPSTTRPTGSGTNFLAVSRGKSLTLRFSSPEDYIGFWWSGGDAGNTLKLYSGGTGGTLVGSFSLSTLVTMLSSGSGATISSIGGTSYNKCDYYLNPVVSASSCPNSSGEPSAYVHIIGVDGMSFDTVVFSESQSVNGAFELDNLAVSSSQVTADNSVVSFPPGLAAARSSQTAATCSAFTSDYVFTASNYSANPAYTISPSLPAGLVIDQATGEISGTPLATSPSSSYTVTATANAQVSSTSIALAVTQVGTLPCSTPAPTPVVPAELAETGSKTLMLSVAGVGLLIAGVMLLISRKLQVR